MKTLQKGAQRATDGAQSGLTERDRETHAERKRGFKMKIKGFNEKLQCYNGYQFEVGKTYDTGATELKLCTDTVFHYCDTLKKVHQFFEVNETNRFCEIEVLGKEISDGQKSGSNKIKIVREIVGKELDELCGKIEGNTGLWNSGDRNSGDWNSGYRNSGDWNSGDRNSGYRNSGDRNSGNWNSGDWNSGDFNSGDRNSGNRNSGDWNSGDFNSCNYSNGLFCTGEQKIKIFNVQTDMTLNEFRSSKYYRALYSQNLELTEWIDDKLITHDYKDACAIWWSKLTASTKKTIQEIPNFNAKIFKEITGIDL